MVQEEKRGDWSMEEDVGLILATEVKPLKSDENVARVEGGQALANSCRGLLDAGRPDPVI